MFLLKCAVQTYAWGKQGCNSKVAELMKDANSSFVIDDNTTYAEVCVAEIFVLLSKLVYNFANCLFITLHVCVISYATARVIYVRSTKILRNQT